MEPMRLLVTDAAAQPPRQATAWLIITLGRSKTMETLATEIRSRFPEISTRVFDGDELLPYTMMGHVASWLREERPHLTSEGIAGRLASFCEWCESQQPGDTASDDILTILVVGLYEKLIEHPATRPLVPVLMSREDFAGNKDYILSHCGSDAYNETLKEYEK